MKTKLIMGIAMFVLLLSCTKKSEKPNCLAIISPLKLNFNLIDKDTKKDLFFSETPKYQINEIAIYKSSDTEKKNPLKVNVETIQGNKNFYIILADFTLNQKSSLLFIVGSTNSDKVEYSVKKTDDVCPDYKIIEINFNQNVINPTNGVYTFLK